MNGRLNSESCCVLLVIQGVCVWVYPLSQISPLMNDPWDETQPATDSLTDNVLSLAWELFAQQLKQETD